MLGTSERPCTLSGMSADLDLFVLTDPYGACVSANCTAYGNDTASFSASVGETYYVVVEGYGYTYSSGTGACRSGGGNYTLSFDVSAGTGCPEDCDDGRDNDYDVRFALSLKNVGTFLELTGGTRGGQF